MFCVQRNFILGCAMVLVSLGAKAQDCSLPFDSVMFAVQEEHDIYYGSAIDFENNSVDLYLNLFKPIGDGQTERPLVVVMHGGGFLDGHRNDRNDICRELAGMGYAAATISYRLDFHGTWLFYSPWAYDPAEVIRAAYRAQQDVRGAIRFLKARHLQDSTNTEKVMLWGYSAGAIAGLHAAYVDDPSEKPLACNQISDVNYLFSNHDRPDLGPIEGTLNLNDGFDASVIGVISNYGGLLDTALIPSTIEPALYTYHQANDPIVGCYHQRGLHGMPLGVGNNYPWLYGSCAIDAHIQTLSPDSSEYQFHHHSGNDHDIHNIALITSESVAFLKALICPAQIQVAARVFLEGPYDPNSGLMFDSLRTLPSFPLVEPYSDMGYNHVSGGAETIDASVLQVTGNDAIVDWVALELRDGNDPAVVLESRSALLQRDGDVVDIDGHSSVQFNIGAGNYYLALKHRNHLDVMTANAISFSDAPLSVDFTLNTTNTFGTEATTSVGNIEALWAGDATFDEEVKYTGSANDRDQVLSAIGGTIPTNIVNAYHSEDLNMDGLVKYTGSDNDRDIVLQTVGGTVPTNVRSGNLP